jgi:hypothetical protein
MCRVREGLDNGAIGAHANPAGKHRLRGQPG